MFKARVEKNNSMIDAINDKMMNKILIAKAMLP
jgi:hypothetical protein